MISFPIIITGLRVGLLLLSSRISLCGALDPDDVSFVRYFVKDWKGYNSVNIFSCPGKMASTVLFPLNEHMILFRYLDMTRPVDLKQMDKENNCRQVYVVDLACSGAEDLIQEMSRAKFFNTFCRSVLLLDTSEDETWFYATGVALFQDIELTVTSDVIYGAKFAINETGASEEFLKEDVSPAYFLYDIWNPGRYLGGTLKFNLLGQFRDRVKNKNALVIPGVRLSSFQVLEKRAPIIRRFDLSEVTLQCAIVVINRFNDTLESYLTHHYQPYLDTTHRLHYSLVRVVQSMFGFHLFVHRTDTWGYLGQNSTNFDGMIGMLQRNEVDIGCSPAFYRVERMIAVDYGEYVWGARPMVIFRHPPGSGKNVFRVPFEDLVWLVMAFVSIVIVVFVAIMLHTEYMAKGHHPRAARRSSMGFGNRTCFSSIVERFKNFLHDLVFLFDSLAMYVGLLCQQGAEYAGRERFLGTRFAMTFMFIYSFLMMQFYSASIVGSLLMAPPKNIKTVQDLVDSELAAGMQIIGYNYDFFTHTQDPVALEFYDKKIHILDRKTGNYTLNFFSIEEGLKKMQRERFAFHVDRDSVFKRIVDSFDMKDICDLQLIRLLPKQHMGTVTKRGSPYRKVLNYGIHRAAETGILFRERSSWITKKPECLRNVQSEDLQVEMKPLKPLFKVYFLGIFFSLVVLLAEIIQSFLSID